MDLYYIDYVSVFGGSWLHLLPVGIKMLALVGIIALLLSVQSIPLYAGTAALVFILALIARLPMKIFIPLALYPMLLLVIIFLSVEGLTLSAALALALRVLAITGAVIAFLLTTSYPAIFGTLGQVLPGFVVAALFFTYRSIFIISDSINNIRTALHLRGGIDWMHPISTLRHFGTALGHFLVHSIEASQRMADSLRVRGFANRVYYLDGRK